MPTAICLLSEQCTFSAFTIVCDELFNCFSCAAEALGKAVYAAESFRSSENKLSEYCNIIIMKGCAAFFAGFIICHYTFTTFALYIMQS